MERKSITFQEDVYNLYYYNLIMYLHLFPWQIYATTLRNLTWVYMPSYKFSNRNVSIK